MTTKLIILLAIGLIVLGLLVWMIVRAWRYRKNHPDDPMGTGLRMFIGIILILGFQFSIFNTALAQGGHGTHDNPYRIRKANELVAFANCLSTGNEFYFYKYGYSKEWICSTTPPTYGDYDTIPAYGEGKYFLIPNDITLNQGNLAACDGEIDPNWTVWPEMVVFKGYLLGDMHTISGIYIDRPDSSVGVGFFSKMEGDAYVEKLGIVNSYIRVGAQSSNIGGMVGELSGGHISDCFFEGSIRTNGSNVGGLVGLMTLHDTLLPEVSVCFASGHVDCSGDYVAGLVGKVEKGTVRHCYSSMIVRTTDMVGTALSGANPTKGGIGTDEEIVNHHIGGIYGYALSPSGSNSYDPDVDSIRVDTCYFDWQLSDLPSIPGSSWVPADWRANRGAAALSTYDMTYYSMMYFDIKNQKPSLWKNTYLCNVYPYPDPFNDPINVTYRIELDYPQDSIVTAALVPFLDVFMKPNGNGQSTINNMNDNERKYMKLSDLTESFVLWKGCDSLDFTWTLDSLWPDAVRREFYAPDNSWNIYLQKQGVVRLTVEVAGRTRYYDAVVNIPPYVGSAENPFLISNLEDFLAFRNGINANEDFIYHRFLIPHDSLPHIHWIQTADIDLAAAGDWVPIGKNADTCFTGFYDGRGHKLMNLTMTDGTDRALFIYSKGDIKNLVIEDPHITGCGGSSAALATIVKGGSFENCAVTYSTQALSTSTTQPLTFVGNQCAALIGSVGTDSEALSSIHITGCFNSCNIVNNWNGGYAAGLVGYVNADTCLFEQCFNTGDITASNGTVHPLVGLSRNTTRRIITDCYNVGVLTGNQVEVESAYTTFYNDYHVNPLCEGATKVATRYFIGPEALVREYMGDDFWLYEEGLYPRLTWTDSSSVRSNAIAACTPRLALNSLPLPDTMTVDNFHDLNNLRNIVNGNYMVIYKDYLLPHYVQDIVFILTADINLYDITSNWIPIGTKRFAGTFLGNNHTLGRLNSTRSVVGLFGTLTGKVYDLNITVETIVGADTAGAVCAILNGGRIENCSVKKHNNVSDNLYGVTVGGIAGVSLTAADSIIGCFNYIDVMGIQCVGGIIAKDGNVKNSANLGDITGKADCPYIGGISGLNTNVSSCLNTGIITALPGNPNADNFVGGLVGLIQNPQCRIQNSYNAGIVNGENRKYVGGICGVGAPQYCYVSNTVRSTGTHLGSIVGQANDTILNCYYDNQLSPVGGIDGSDQSGLAEGMPTSSMMGSILFGGDSSDSIWYFQNDYYPQLKGVQSINSLLSKASAMRAKLYTTETYSTVSHQFTLNYSDGGSWLRMGGSNCLSIGTSPSNNLITVTIPSTNNRPAQGFITLGFRGTGTNDPVYRKLQLWVNLTEANPIIIRNADELKNFRTIINQGSGYYNSSTQTFITTGSYSASQYVRITDGGRNLYFKLNADVDLAFHGTTSSGQQYNVLDLWTSIGTPNRPFLGHFDGAGHTVSNFLIPGGDNQGFFGYIYGGSVKNLTIAGAITNHNTSGNHRAILCGYLNSGTIRNCFITQLVGSNFHSPSRISAVSGRNIGFICGSNHYGRIVRCQTDMTQIENATYTHGSCFGGICGFNDFGTIDSCRSHLAVNPGVTIDTVGGIVGFNHNGILRADTSYNNSYNKSIISHLGCIAGFSFGEQSEIRSCYVDEQSRIPSHGNYIGGVVGKMDDGIIDGCEHLGTIIAEGNYIGGIAGLCVKGARITNSFNAGTVGETKIDDYLGGIVGSLSDSSSVSACFNSGLVTGRYFVGGLIGQLSDASLFSDCYNTGVVKGISLVGGIAGLQQDPSVPSVFGYSAGWVEGASFVGALCGFSSDTSFLLNLHYDSLMCPYRAVNEEDVSGVTPLSTSEMMGVTFPNDRPWVYGEGMYPRLSTISDTDASKVSALALQIGDIYNLTAIQGTSYTLPSYTPASGTFKWNKVKSSDNTASLSGTTLTASGKRNFMQIKASKSIFCNGENHTIPFRTVQLSFGISEEQPLDVNFGNFSQFRYFVNNGQTFYYFNGAFFQDQDQYNNYTPIPAGSDGIYFRLTSDITIPNSNSVPIGTEEIPFRGYFDGGGHSVQVKFAQTNQDNRGFFGYLQGRVKNLYVKDISVTGRNRVGALAGFLNGTVSHCGTLSSCSSTPVVQGQTAVGGLVGEASFSQISHCYNGSNVRGTQSVGGIVGAVGNADVIMDNHFTVVKQCFNYGIVSASDTDSRAAGLVGSTINSYLLSINCYNTGAVNGTSRVAGLFGSTTNSNLLTINCYNAAPISADTLLGPFVGQTINSNLLSINCFNDRQLCPLHADDSTARLTSEMIGDGLKAHLGEDSWIYNDHQYPHLKAYDSTMAATVSVKPVYLTGRMPVNSIVADFKADTTTRVKWYRYGTGSALNEPNPDTANGSFTLNNCGKDSLMVVLTDDNVCARRVVPLIVAASNIKVDTILSCSAYTWKPTNDHTEILDKPGFYSYSPDGAPCDSTRAIELLFSSPIQTSLAARHACMDSYWSKYGHNIGSLKASVISGGFSSHFSYQWSRENGTIDNESFIPLHPDSLRYLPADNYILTVTDSAAPLCQSHDTILVDEYSFNYLATKWGNCVDTDDGWIELVIRQFEFNRDGSPYKIECWDSNHTVVAEHTIHSLNLLDDSGIPKGYDTLSNLANGLYYITITDSLGCYQDKQIKVNDPINPKMTLRANGFKKVYDGTPVSLNDINRIQVIEYDDNWKVPERAEYYITSDQWRQLALRIGDSLIVSLSNPDMMIKDVDSVRNEIVGWSIKDAETGKDKTCLYHFYPVDSCIVIVPATLTLFTGSATKEYDGTELTNYNWNVQGLQNGEHVWCMPSASLTDVDTIENSCYIDWGNPGHWGENIAQEKNYTVINHFGTLSVTPNTQPVTITAGSSTKTYDGTPLTNDTITFTGLPNGFYVEATTSGSRTDVGTSQNVVNSYVIKNKDHQDKTAFFTNVTTIAGTLTVNPTQLTVITGSSVKEYDGTPLTSDAVCIRYGIDTIYPNSSGQFSILNSQFSIQATGSQTIVGQSNNSYTIDWGTTDSNNYEIHDNLGVLTVNLNSTQITLTAASVSKPYDGTPLTNSDVNVDIDGSLPTGFTVEATVSGRQTNVGTNDNVVSSYAVRNADGEDRTAYFSNITTVNGVLTVTANATTVTLTAASGSKTYDGTPLTKNDYTVAGLPEGFTMEATVSGSQTDAGSSANVVNDDYIIRNALGEDKTSDFTGVLKVAGTLTVTPKPATITAHDASKTYGEADPAFTATVTGAVNGETIGYTLSRTSGETVGTYAINVNDNDNPNYEVTVNSAQLTISPRPISVSVEERTVTYNGFEQGGNTAYNFSNLLAGHTATISYTPSRGRDEGAYDNGGFDLMTLRVMNGEEDVTDNYSLTSVVPGGLTIEPVTDPSTLTVRARSSRGNVYDGTVKSVAGFETLEFVVNGDIYTVSGLSTSDPSSRDADTLENEIMGEAVVRDANNQDVTPLFTVNRVNGTLIVAPRPVTVRADSKSKIYGEVDPELTATVTGAVMGDTIDYTLSRTSGETVGTYAIVAESGDNPNYTVSVEGGTFAIEKKYATVTANNKSKTYGEEDPELTATVTGRVGDDSIDYTLSRTSGETVGTYAINVNEGENPNYEVTVRGGTFTITRAALTVKADDKEKTFGALDPTLTATVTGRVGDDSIAYTLSRTSGETVGTYTIMPVGNVLQGNYDVTYVAGALTISSSDEVVVRIAGRRDTAVYNGAPHSVSGYDVISISNSLYTEDDFTFNGTATATRTDAGTTLMGLNGNQFANRNLNFAHVNFIVVEDGCQTITKARATVAADTFSKIYGDADPALTATLTGTFAGDTIDYALSRTSGETVGTYAINVNVNEGDNPNYEVTVTGAIFTINKKAATVVADNLEKTYGESDTTLTATVTGTVGNDSIAYTLSRTSGETVGTYAISVTLGSNPNYEVTATNGIFSINKKAVRVVVDALGKIYGEEDPELTATVTGTVEGDSVYGSGLIEGDTIAYTLSREAGENAGEYLISAMLGDNPNYEVTTVPGIFTIGKRIATVKADNMSKTYGEADPELTATVADTLPGDTLNYTLERTAGENAGSYFIAVTLGNNPNYEVAVTHGIFTINPRTVTVAAKGSEKTYGESDPTLTATVSGTLGSDVVSYTLSRTSGETVGTYAITVTPGSNPNYELTTVPATFIINKRAATVTATGKSKTYGNADPALTATVTGTVGSDVVSYTLSREVGEDVGTYAIVAESGNNPNYEVTTVPGTFSIVPATAMVMADNKEKVHGTPDPVLTATVTGLKNGDAEGVLSYTMTRDSGDSVGTYAITPLGAAKQGNYNVTYLPGTLTIVNDTLIIIGGLESVTVRGCSANSVPAPYTTVAQLEEAGLTIQGDCQAGEGFQVSSHDVEIGMGCATVMRTYTITDVCGDSVTISQTIYITHDEAPHEVGGPVPTSSDVHCVASENIPPHENPDIMMPTVEDTCGNELEYGTPTIINNYSETTRSGDITYIYTYRDCAGKEFQWNYTYHVIPIIISFTAPEDTAVCRNADGSYSITPEVTGTVRDVTVTYSTVDTSYTDANPVQKPDGSLTIVRTWTLSGICQNAVSEEQRITVLPLPTLQVNPVSQTITYGDTIENVVISNTHSSVTVSSLPAGLTYNASTQTISGRPSAVGNYTITVEAVSDQTPNCGTAVQKVTIVVGKRNATITALNQSYVFNYSPRGENNATYTDSAVIASKVSVTGLQGDDQLTSITLNGQETLVGVYPEKIDPNAAVIGTATDNYNIEYISGTLTITEYEFTVTGTLDTLTVNGCSAADAPEPYTTVAQLEAAGLSIQVDCPLGTGIYVSNNDASTGATCVTVTRTYTISDDCGNSATADQFIYINHNEAPHEVGGPVPASSDILCYSGNLLPPHENPDITMPTVEDSCDNELSFSEPVLNNNYNTSTCSGDITYDYTYTDCAGKVFQWHYTYHILPPTITFSAPEDIAVCRNTDGSYTITPDVTGTVQNVVVSCSTVDTTYSDADPVENQDGSLTIVRTWTLTGSCQNAVSEEQTITVNAGTHTEETVTECNSYIWKGTEYTVSGTYYHYGTNASGCPDTAELELTVNHAVNVVTTETACDSFAWNGTTYTASGDYTYSHADIHGCTQVDTLHLTINTAVNLAVTETACDSFAWNGVTYIVSGNYTYSHADIHGCSQVDTLHLTINSAVNLAVTETACDSFVWNATTYTSTGTYTYTHADIHSCTQVDTLHLTINSAVNVATTETACDSFAWNGTTYTASGNYTYSHADIHSCTQVDTLHLTINNAVNVATTETACDSFAWNGVTYTVSGDYTYSHADIHNCTQVDTLHLTINSAVNLAVTETACDSFAWNGTTYTASGNYTYTHADIHNCTQVDTLHLTINSAVNVAITETACDSFAWNGVTYTVSGDYTYSHADIHSCTQVDTLHLTINSAVNVAVTEVACDSFFWNGTTYTASGDYTYTHADIHGCTQVDTLHLTINSAVNVATTETACDSLTWNGTTYTASGTYTYSHADIHGCTQVDTLHLTINTAVNLAVTETACDSFAWNGITYTASGDYTYSHADIHNCTQVDTLHLTINTSVNLAVTETACDSFVWNATTYTSTGNYTYSHADIHSCTQVDTLHLTIKNPIHTAVTETACDSFAWNATTYTSTGNYTYSHADIHSCTQVDTLHLTINTAVNVATTETACDSFAWNGTTYTASGDYTYSHADIHSCTQVDTLHLTINNPIHTAVTESACDSFSWNGTEYTESGNYTYSHADIHGCTQVDTLHLTINSAVNVAVTEVACDSFAWNGTTYTTSGNYTYSHADIHGCSQVDTLHLTINSAVNLAVTETACDSFAWNGVTYIVSGNYTYSHADIHGCTQVDTLHLTINSAVNVATTETACDSFSWNGTAYTASGDYTYSHTDIHSCSQVDTLHLIINMTVYTDIEKEAYGSCAWHGIMYSESGDYTYTTNAANGCDSIVTLHLSITPIHTVTLISSNEAWGTVSSSGSVVDNGYFAATATPLRGYAFIAWLEGTDTLSTHSTFVFQVNHDMTLTALFAPNNGIDDVDMTDVSVYSSDSRIFVRGAEGYDVYVYDVNGRMMDRRLNAPDLIEFHLSSSGVYLVKVGNAPARRVVLIL